MGPVEILREWGFEVHEFTSWHFRVNGEFDFYLPRGKWHDLVLGDRGTKPLDQIPYFVKTRLEGRKACKERQLHQDFSPV